ncbi:hypothetical protein BDC45DRAFT_523502 [Circinella umbellata]|nr:hypothetical protein BDC45DRAFT_523502 [Circinella umbellata]
MSVGTFIGQLARNSRSSQERRNQYFTALGMNGVLDINDTLSGGQLHAILNRMNDDRSNETPSYSTDGLKALMGPLIYGVLPPTPGPVFHLEQQLKENVIDQIEKDDRQWKKWYEVIKKQSIEGDKSERYIDSYIHIIKLHMYHPTLFGNSMTLSEQDYVIKIWYGFVETFFRCTDIEAHWGDTIPNIVLIYGIAMRMDSQPLDIINKSAPVYGIDEFEEEVFSSNYYKDKLKAVLSVKAHLNYLLTCNNIPDDEVNKIKYPFMLVAGFEIELYSLHLAAPGLYVLNSIHSAYFPTTVKEANEGSIKAVVSLLDCFKTICLNIKTYQKVRNETHQVNRRKSMNDRTNDTRRHSNSKSISSSTAPASSSNTSVDSTKWTRDIWDPK